MSLWGFGRSAIMWNTFWKYINNDPRGFHGKNQDIFRNCGISERDAEENSKYLLLVTYVYGEISD